MGSGSTPKQYLSIAGEPILARSIAAFLHHPRISEVVVVLPPDDVRDPPAWLGALPVERVAGGAERGDSVWNGLQALSPDVELVLVHDAARPLVDGETIDRVVIASEAGAVIAAVAATDTLKEVDGNGAVLRTLDRAMIWQAQTPQGFPRALLLDVHRRARIDGVRGTDDAALCERYGIPVRIVEGSYDNIKITRPEDLSIAEALARRSGDESRAAEEGA